MNATITRSTLSGSSATSRTVDKKVWTARILGALVILFLLVDGAGKVMRLAPYVEGTARVGYSAGSLVPLGLVLLASTILYAVPRTAVLGAILLTAYLGGATATPVVFGVIVWGCLYLRDERVRSLLPITRR